MDSLIRFHTLQGTVSQEGSKRRFDLSIRPSITLLNDDASLKAVFELKYLHETEIKDNDDGSAWFYYNGNAFTPHDKQTSNEIENAYQEHAVGFHSSISITHVHVCRGLGVMQ